jgi:transglutaminase-like putative cysteine protease
VVEVDDETPAHGLDLATARADPSWDDVAALLGAARGDLAVEVAPFVAATRATPEVAMLDELVGDLFVPGRSLSGLVRAVGRRIHQSFVFDPGFSDVATPVAEVVAARRGVCQDFAHVMLACLRSKGLAARYVSGYVETLPPPGAAKLVGVDASHAWCSVWSPVGGWLDIDPTNDQMPPSRHVTVAWGRDYTDVAPVRGVVIGPSATQHLSVAVDVGSSSVG